jgi:CheY-like chemotaxis protein
MNGTPGTRTGKGQHDMDVGTKPIKLGRVDAAGSVRHRSHQPIRPTVTTGLPTVLLVDDDEIDVLAVTRAFKALRIANPVVIARDGIEALDILRGTNGRGRLPAPYLVLLDLNMPRMGGVEFLTELRSDSSLCQTIVFVMTTSEAHGDRVRAYHKNVAGYVLKQGAAGNFIDSIAMLHHYWTMVQFPG